MALSFRRRSAAFLRRIADRLDPPPDRSPVVKAARVLVGEAERMFGAGYGEAKRHFVYASLIKAYPNISKRVLSRAIEDAL